MQERVSTDDFVRELASTGRLLLLGGLAIIAHGSNLREFEGEGDPYSRDILAAWRARRAGPAGGG